MSGLLLGAYRPGRSLLHRLPAGAKLLGFFLMGVVVVLVRGPAAALVLLAAAAAACGWARLGLRTTLGALRAVLVMAALLAAYQSWQHGWAPAVESVADLLTLVLLATVLTTTTPVDEMLDTIARSLRPLRPVGVDPERVALAFSLMIRAIPTTIEIAEETRDAARARGLERDPRARLVPLVIRVVAHARATGDALHARGIGDD